MHLHFIDTPKLDDPRLDDYRDIRDRDLMGPAGRPGLFIGEQFLTVLKMLSSPGLTKSVLITPPWKERLLHECPTGDDPTAEVPVYVLPQAEMDAVVGFHIHRGVLAVGYRPSPEMLTLDAAVPDREGCERPLTLLLCEGISNIDNVGQLFRNAAAFGVNAVVLSPKCHDPLYRKCVRVSIGHVLSMPWARSTDWLRDLERLQLEWNVTLVAAATAPHAQPVDEIAPPHRVGIVVGPEFEGLPEATLKRSDAIARIPMAKHVDSLNVAAASAVMLHRFSRAQRQ